MREATLATPLFVIRLLCAAACVLVVGACGSESSTGTFVGPSQTRCAIQARSDTTSFASSGGGGVLRITADRECAWTVQSEASWLGLQPEPSGHGDGSIRFTVAANSDPPSRSARLTVNDQGVQISQAGQPCGFRLSSTRETVAASGERRTVHVDSSSAQCQWSATSDVPWITIIDGRTRSGSGDLHFEAAAVTGPPRTGTITIAGQRVDVEQGTGCTYTTAVAALNVGAEGGTSEVPVSAPPGCTWKTESQAAWITVVKGESASGSGSAVVRVEATAGPPRSGTIVVAGRTVTVTQSSGCAVTFQPASHAAPVGGGTGTVTVASAAGCSWTAASNAPWVTLTAGVSGTGPGQVQFTVAANTGPPRSGSLTIGGHAVTVSQPSGCTASIQPASHAAPVGGGTGSVTVQSAAGCSWTAASNVPWATITAGASGSGAGQVQFTVAANIGPARSGSLTIGGQAVAVSQPSGCTFSVTPGSLTLTAGAQSGTVSLSTASGCRWGAASQDPWMTLPVTSGSGPAQVSFAVDTNNAPQRSGVLVVEGNPVSVTQLSACIWGLEPPLHEMGPDGGRGNVLVIMEGSCTWTAFSPTSWITMEAGTSGTGNGLVQFIVAPNYGPARRGVVKIAGFDYVVTQPAR